MAAKTKKTIKKNTKKKDELDKRLMGQIALVIGGFVIVLGLWSNMFKLQVRSDSVLLQKLGVIAATPTPLPIPDADYLQSVVVPESGYEVDLNWGEVGKKIVEAGGIDMDKYSDNYQAEKWQEEMKYLTSDDRKGIKIDSENAYFWVNTLWAMGLTQHSKVLTEGVMGTEYEDQIGQFASTGGWTLGSKDAVSLYSSSQIIDLDDGEQNRVVDIAAGIFRPCCGNPTSFPDCNHGMAILGLVELMVDQGYSDAEIYEAALSFNSFWFPQTYIDLAYYFQTVEGTLWKDVDAKRVLGAEFSSAPAYQKIKEKIGNVPGSQVSGGSCGA